jgi:zinc protease
MRSTALAAIAAIAVVVAVAVAACAAAGTPPPAHAFPLWERTLPSGIRVVIEQDDTSRVAGVVLLVDSGSVDDPIDKPGLAHTLEHLVFRIPDETGLSLAERLGRNAAQYNGTTGAERTTYFAFVPRQSLDDAVAALLARMADPLRGATDALLAREASIVAEELRLREGASGLEVLMPLLLPHAHPHARAAAATRQTATLSLADVRAFAERHYRPERMTLVISGPVSAAWEKALYQKLPAQLYGRDDQPRPPARRPIAAFLEPAPMEAELPIHRGKVAGPELWIAWRLPPTAGVAVRKLEVIGRVASQVLSRRLQRDDASDIRDVQVQVRAASLSSALFLRVGLRSSADAARIRDECTAAVAALADMKVMRRQGRVWWGYVQAVQEATLRTVLGMESLRARTMARADLVHAGASPLLSTVIDALLATSVDEVSELAARHLSPETARSALLLPQRTERVIHRGHADDVMLTPALGAPDAGVFAHPEPSPDADDDARELSQLSALATMVAAPGARAARVQTLRNGLTVIALRRPGLPFVSLHLGFHADPQPGDAPGAPHVIDTSLRSNLPRGPLERGLLRHISRDDDGWQQSLTTLASNAENAFALLSEEASSLDVLWPNPKFDRWLDGAARIEASAEGRAALAVRAEVFGDHPYRLRPATADVRKVTEPEAAAWLKRIRRPANGALVIVGDIDPEVALRQADDKLGGWHGDALPPPAPPAPPPPGPATPPRILHVEDPSRASALLHFGCLLPAARSPRDVLAQDLLADIVTEDLRRQLREHMGASYAPSTIASTLRGGTSWLHGTLDVDGKAADAALAIVGGWLDPRRPVALERKAFERARWQRARRSALLHTTNDEMAGALFAMWNHGWPPAALDDYPRDVAAVTTEEVTAALQACRARSVITVLAAAPVAYN